MPISFNNSSVVINGNIGVNPPSVSTGPLIKVVSTFTGGSLNSTGVPFYATGTSVAANSLLVALVGWDSGIPENSTMTVTSTPALTWNVRAVSSGIQVGNTQIATASFAAGGNITLTGTMTNGVSGAMAILVITGAVESSSVSASTTAWQAAPNVPITTTANNSIVVGVIEDWQGIAPPYTYRRAVNEVLYWNRFAATDSIGYHFYDLTTSGVSTYFEGLSAPTTQQSGVSLLEIKSL